MALARIKTWLAGEVLYASDLNAEHNNPLNNALSLISPLPGNLAAGGNDITGLDELAFNDADADATATGRLRRTNESLEWHDATGSWALQLLVGGGIFGLTLSNDATDPTNDIGIAVGQAIDDTEVYTLRLSSALIKRLDAAWAVGTNAGMLDAGAIANTTYHIFIIKRSDTGVTDILASTSATAPTMPTSYDYKRIIGSIIRSGGTILAFTQYGDWFQLATPVEDYDATNPGTNAVTVTHTVPVGIAMDVVFNALLSDTTAGDNTLLFFDGALTHPGAAATATATGGQLTVRGAAAGALASGQMRIRCDTSAGTKFRLEASDATRRVQVATQGFWHPRGRDS